MSSLRLEALREKLLQAGIAPRHVRRYQNELRQHFDDLLCAEIDGGLTGEAAFLAARARLGSDDALAAAMLARPELRSLGARYPWAVFGLAPAALLGLSIVAAVFVEVGVVQNVEHGARLTLRDWHGEFKSLIMGWDWAMMYLFPPVVIALFFCLGARQFVKMHWLALGAILVAVLGAIVSSATIISAVPHQSSFSVGFGFNSDTSWPRLAANIALVSVMSALYWLWHRNRVILPD